MMSALSLASARFSKLWMSFVNDLLDGDLCKNFFDFYIFIFLTFNRDFIIYIDFTHIAASNKANDDVAN